MTMMRTMAAVAVALLIAVPAIAQTVLQKAVISTGGGTATSAASRIDATIAEPVTGVATNGQTVGQFGFWTTSGSIILGAENEHAGIIRDIRVSPSPAVDVATVRLSLASASSVELSLFDAGGRRIATRSMERVDAGTHTVVLDLAGLASGSYSLVASVDGALTRIPLSIVR